VIGLGQIGREVVERARAFEMPVIAWSRSLTNDAAKSMGVVRAETPIELAGASDIVSVHLAGTPETKHLVNAGVFAAMKPGSTFINTARGEVVDYEALAAAVETKRLRVGLDVYPHEPAAASGLFADPLIKGFAESADSGIIYGTHHIGASTDQAQNAIAEETVRIVEHYLASGAVLNCVNLCARSPARWSLSVRHLNRPGVLAHVLNEISHAGINVEEMANIIYSGAAAACAQIRLDARLPDEALERIRAGNAHILAVSVTQLDGE
jgi:D-3-phosphoglycerate dehydrogenase